MTEKLHGKSVRVVMLDDNSLDRDQMHFALNKLRPDIEFLSYDSPSDFILDLESKKFTKNDLIILDLNMPRLSGHDVLRFIRATPEMSDAAVVILSGSDRKSDKRASAAMRVAAYYAKPMKLAGYIEIADQIAALLPR